MNTVGNIHPLQGLFLILKRAKGRAVKLGFYRILPWLSISEDLLKEDAELRSEALKLLGDLQISYNPSASTDARYAKIRSVLRVDIALSVFLMSLFCWSLFADNDFRKNRGRGKNETTMVVRGKRLRSEIGLWGLIT